MVIAGAAFAVAHPFVKRWRPKPGLASQVTIVALSTLFVFVSVFFFNAWGYNPAVIQVNLQQSLNPLRWVNWVLSALSFGVAQAFVLALVRNRIEQARRLGALPPPSRQPEGVLGDRPALEGEQPEPAPDPAPGAAKTPTYALSGEPRRLRFVQPSFRFFAPHPKKGVEP